MKHKPWDKITLLSQVSEFHLYKIHEKKYYIIGDQTNKNDCESLYKVKCDEFNKYPSGSKCTTIQALLDNWLKYNNIYNYETNCYIDVDDVKINNHFDIASKQCYQRENKCPLYPHVNVYINNDNQLNKILNYVVGLKNINDQQINEITLMLTGLFDYYKQLGHYIFDDKKMKIKDLKLSDDIYNIWLEQIDIPVFNYIHKNIDINHNIKNYGKQLYFDYLEKIREIHHINDGELFLILNMLNDPSKELDVFKTFVIDYINLVKPLFTMLWDFDAISQMFISEQPTQIVYTNYESVKFFTSYFKNYKDYINLTNINNCITIKPKDIPADEYRWTLFKNTQPTKSVNVDLIKNYNLSSRPQRAGVIIYYIDKNNLYFGFGVDSEYKELTDFGGHLDWNDKNAITGGLREFKEESLGIFNYQYNDVLNDVIIYDDKMVILFIKVGKTPEEINKEFKMKLKFAKKPEVNDIKWLSLDELKNELNNSYSKIYTRVKHHLSSAGDFYKKL
jgi:hypothetical protein